MTATTFTHTISSRKVLRYLPHHHRGALLNKTHAATLAGRVYDGAEAATVCGMVLRAEELPEVLAADGGPLYNCRPAADASRVTCKDCRKKLGM